MSIAMNKNFNDLQEFEIDRITTHILERTLQILTSLSEILDNYPLTKLKLEEIQQGTIDCILWNEDQTSSIALDQNKYLYHFRQTIRKSLFECLEFAQEILIIDEDKNELNMIIQKSMLFFDILNDYRVKRQSAYHTFVNHHSFEDAMLVLINVDKQQFHHLRFIALYLRQFFLRLMTFINPKNRQFPNKNRFSS